MKQRIYKELEELERVDAAALQARTRRRKLSPAAVFRELVGNYASETLAGESLAETIARTAEISARALKDHLWERAQATGLRLQA
jgi:hypothetical protein